MESASTVSDHLSLEGSCRFRLKTSFLFLIHLFRYFTALASGNPLPVKRRLEPGATGLSPGLLDVLHQQLKDTEGCSLDLITKKWNELGLPKQQLSEIVQVGSFVEDVEFIKFFAVASSHLGGGVSDFMFCIKQ